MDAALLRLAAQAVKPTVVESFADGIARECVVVEFDVDASATSSATAYKSIAMRSTDNRRSWYARFQVCLAEAGWPQQSMGFDEWQQLADLAIGKAHEDRSICRADIRRSREESSSRSWQHSPASLDR